MTDESALQADSATDDVVVTTKEDAEVSVTPEVEAPLASASESEHEENPESDNDKAQKAINKQTWKFHEEKRRADSLESELAALKTSQSVADVEPNVPPLPDAILLSDEEFREQMTARDDVIRQHSAFKERESFQAQEQVRQQQAQTEKQQQSVDEIRKGYVDRAVTLGLEPESVLTATAEIANFGLSDAVAEMIATEADGPLMAMYLRQNPVELQSFQTMPTYQQIDRMRTAIRDGANTLKPKASNAPPPPTDIRGSGSLSGDDDPLLDGLTLNIS